MVLPPSHLSAFFSDVILICHFPPQKKAEYAVADFKYSQIKHLIAVSMDRKSMKSKVPGLHCACFCDDIFSQILFFHRAHSRNVSLLLCRKSLARDSV